MFRVDIPRKNPIVFKANPEGPCVSYHYDGISKTKSCLGRRPVREAPLVGGAARELGFPTCLGV